MALVEHTWANIPLKHVACFVRDAAKTADAPFIVSVGSGTGAYEFEISEGRPDLRARLILVDPAPSSFQPVRSNGREIAPHYATVTDLVAARPEVVGHCIVLLLWALPNDMSYDADAIDALQPRGIVSLTEAIDPPHACAAGSTRFHSTYLSPTSDSGYRIVSEARYRFRSRVSRQMQLLSMMFGNPRETVERRLIKLTWLAKRGASIVKDRPSDDINRLAEALAEW